jgi:hypothetical protein
MLADLEVAVASFDRAGLGEQHLLLLRQKAALLTHYGLCDEAASVPQLRDCHRRLADTLLGEPGPANS